MKRQYTLIAAVACLVMAAAACSLADREPVNWAESIPVTGNSWAMNDLSLNRSVVGNQGIRGWGETSTDISTFFRTEGTGRIDIAVVARVVSGKSEIEFTFACRKRKVTLRNTGFDTIRIGTFNLTSPGYQTLGMRGVSRTDTVFAEVTAVLIAGEAIGGKATFVRDDFYFGRRGPSVHLRYEVPEKTGEIEYFYNEITVTEGNDVPGSFYMANGFGHGYFGIQVNSEKERRILFSVWSPYRTDNPAEIPDGYKIELLDRGTDVVAGEFGNEGSGGQSFRRYMWKAGTTYGFLLRAERVVKGSTDFTAWFYAPEEGKWALIASFRRPHTEGYLTSLHSFLENFRPETGPIPRQGYYSNQWIKTIGGEWIELTGAVFTADATARKGARLDFTGGAEGNRFFLKNCGFFNAGTAIGSEFEREATSSRPVIEIID